MKKSKLFIKLMCVYIAIFSFSMNVFADNTKSAISCSDLGNFQKDLQNLFDLLKIVIPLLIIGLSVIDFVRAVAQKDEKDVKKAFNKLGKRFVCAIILFLLPVILGVLLKMAGITTEICVN